MSTEEKIEAIDKTLTNFVSHRELKFILTLIFTTMIKIYGMETCPDCTYVEEQVKGNDKYEVIDIGLHVKDLKAFLKLRDHNAVFDEAKKMGAAGIPCFVLEDGTVTLTPEDAGLRSRPMDEGVSCSIDGTGC